MNTEVIDGVDLRIVGWGTFEELSNSILHGVFGEMVKRATPVIKFYHGDLFTDAEWLRRNVTGPTSFEFCVRTSGTGIGESAPITADLNEGNAFLYRVTLTEKEGAWSVRFALTRSPSV